MHSRFAYLDGPKPLAIAHRGGPTGGGENSLDAFDAVQRLGYGYIETDVRTTSDGVPLIFHDADLRRVTGVAGRITRLPAARIHQIAAEAHTPIPTLSELLEHYPDIRFNLDMKDEASLAAVTSLVAAPEVRHRVCVTSFSDHRIRRARQLLGPDVCTGVGSAGAVDLALRALLGRGFTTDAGALQIPMTWRGRRVLTLRLVRSAHEAGLDVHVWTLNTLAEIEAALDLGVDGIMTDNPVLLKESLQRRSLWS